MTFWIEWILAFLVIVFGRSHADRPCEITVMDYQEFGAVNEIITLNCTSTCSTPVWKTNLRKSNILRGSTWSSVDVALEMGNFTATCFSADGNISSIAPLCGYVPPSQVTIDMPEVLEEGTVNTITCKVYSVFPEPLLRMSVTRDRDIIYEETFEKNNWKTMVDKTMTYNFTAERSDNLKDFSCNTILELGTYSNVTKSSSSVTIRTFNLPSPEISSEVWIEQGSNANSSFKCTVPHVFPPENVTLDILFEETYLSPNIERLTDGTVMGTGSYSTSSSPIGKYKLKCKAQLFNFAKNQTLDVNIYEHPTVNFTLPIDTVDLDNTVTAYCDLTTQNIEPYSVGIFYDQEKACEDQQNCDFTVTRRARTTNITCKAYLRENPNIAEVASKVLSVHYPPRFTNDLCPERFIWVENKTKDFICSAEGNPEAKTNCNIPFLMTKNDSDTYTCVASNRLGNVTTSVNLTVQYQPSSPVISKTPNSDIDEGNSVNLTCESDCLPTCEYSWVIPPGTSVEYAEKNRFIIINSATHSHSGEYICNVKNKHGIAETRIDITVKGKNWLPVIIVVIVIIVLLAAAALLVYYLWRKGKIGSYHVQNSKQKKLSKENIPLSNGA
ncbi:intercellular adhesion molecule 5-like isoform X2 [Pelobates fuscus]|uniref:intercellular adhesion molecule 5-like isoform X2 n=1 Tax=Pelobates fuscus TaxID=191477 RepID=UPI002FE4366F